MSGTNGSAQIHEALKIAPMSVAIFWSSILSLLVPDAPKSLPGTVSK